MGTSLGDRRGSAWRSRRTRRPALVALAGLVLVVACSATTPAPSGPPDTDPADQRTIVAVFRDQADLGGVEDLAWEARGREVVRRLRVTAERSQRRALDLARRAGVAVRSYWITNTAVVTGTHRLTEAVAALPEVERVYESPVHPRATDETLDPIAAGEIASPPPDLVAIGVPDAWAAGARGGGVVVGVIDTGADGSHPALRSSLRGGGFGWHDAVGSCATPCDEVGHGTMVTGLIAGGPPGVGPSETSSDPAASDPASSGPAPAGEAVLAVPQIGVAPEATWIAARACTREGCPEAALLDAAQWMLAPTAAPGDEPDPGRRPDVVANAWGLAADDASLDRVVVAWRAAGITAVFAAGNDGPACGTVLRPGALAEVVTVGASDEAGAALPLSARGGDGVAKPDLVAPGAAAVSAVPGGGYASGEGTSFATPLVAGALAAVLGTAADPRAADAPARAVAALLDTARPVPPGPACGGVDPAGRGRLDVGAAVDASSPR